MRVVNRDGELVSVSYEAIRSRLLDLCNEEEKSQLDIDIIIVQTIAGLHNNITTSQLDELSAMVCASLQSKHYMYDSLAGKILVSSLHKNIRRVVGTPVPATFSQKVCYAMSRCPGLYSTEFYEFVMRNSDIIDAMVDYTRDGSNITYFSYRTLEKAYLLRVDDRVIEAPQDMWMRVAVSLFCTRPGDAFPDEDRLTSIRSVYEHMSTGLYTHATPTLFNAGMRHEQMSSCYLLGTDDSLAGIFKTLSDCAQISKWAGGIGLHISNIRAKGSMIRSTNGKSDGIVPMLKVFNETARYCNQSGRRKGSIAVYLEPWHADVFEFIELRRNTGAETVRARDLFLALWVPDLFMRRVIDDGDWYLMSPDDCPGLSEAYGQRFEDLYNSYVTHGKFVRKIKAQTLWMGVMKSQIETGTPYILFKDTINKDAIRIMWGRLNHPICARRSHNSRIPKPTPCATLRALLSTDFGRSRPGLSTSSCCIVWPAACDQLEPRDRQQLLPNPRNQGV
jgi:ribonucleotide reductase alpha subunit